MKRNIVFIGILFSLFIILALVEINSPKPIDWKESYSKSEKKPYASYAVFDILQDLFPDKIIEATYQPLYNVLSETAENSTSNYVYVNNAFEPEKNDLIQILNYVANGNKMFVAAKYFDEKFLDTLSISTTYSNKLYDSDCSVFFVEDKYTVYTYKQAGISNVFSKIDSLTSAVLAKNKKDEAVMLKVKFGDGFFILSTSPLLFTNYNLLHKNNNQFIEKAFTQLPVADVIWDEYYKVGRLESKTPLRFILGNEALKLAYFTSLFFLLTYIFVFAKRRQKIIPVIEPLKNTSVEFTETVGRLYFQKKDHKDIAIKKYKFFLERIRSTYNIKTNDIDEKFIQLLANKSGVDIEELNELFDHILFISNQEKISESELLKCNKYIENFYQKTSV